MTVMAGVLLAVAGLNFKSNIDRRCEAMSKWEEFKLWRVSSYYDGTVEELGPLYNELSWNCRYLYDYGYALHKAGKWAESNAVLKRGAEISSDPMFHNIIGKNYVESGQNDSALAEYEISRYMVPSRIYPLVLMLEMYTQKGQYDETVRILDEIVEMPVNPKNRTMMELKHKTLQKYGKQE